MKSPASVPTEIRPGRRKGPSETRPLIVKAARELFAEKGYDGTSLRAVARAAGVDPALVHHFFDGKPALFIEALEFPINPAVLLPQIAAGPREDIGERLVRTFLGIWSDPDLRPRILAIVRSASTSEQGAAMVREFMTAAVLDRVSDMLDIPRLNMVCAVAQMFGVAMLRFVLELEPLVSATEDELVELLAPTIQRYLA